MQLYLPQRSGAEFSLCINLHVTMSKALHNKIELMYNLLNLTTVTTFHVHNPEFITLILNFE